MNGFRNMQPFLVWAMTIALIVVILLGLGCAATPVDSFPRPAADCVLTELQEGHAFLIICNIEETP